MFLLKKLFRYCIRDANGNNINSWLSQCNIGDVIKIQYVTDYTEYGFYNVTSGGNGSTFRHFSLSYIGGVGTIVFGSGEYMISYSETGPTGPTLP